MELRNPNQTKTKHRKSEMLHSNFDAYSPYLVKQIKKIYQDPILPKCRSKNDVLRYEHDLDRDGKCYFCNYQAPEFDPTSTDN